MGYYTVYTLEDVYDEEMEDDGTEKVKDYIYSDKEIQNKFDDLCYALFDGRGSTKWYDHESDMVRLSKQFPRMIFTLKGEGEESGDIWKKYFFNGRIQIAHAKIEFDEFRKDKLEKVEEN